MTDSEFGWQQTDDRCVIHGRGVRLAFERTGDRWTHSLEFGPATAGSESSGIRADALQASTDQDDAARIVSPVYQELTRHEFAGDGMRGVCLLLTGRLFAHHFSAAVSVQIEPDEPSWVVIEFDIADRCRVAVASLSAPYQLPAGSSDLIDAGPHAITWSRAAPDAGIPAGRLELRCDSPGSLALAEAGRQATRVQALAAIDPARFTHRLRYRWLWASRS
jgi:hypothetical protein